jgi:glycosyltransferase involved in cell wall biosynthesis
LRLLVTSQHFWPENFRINDLVKALLAEGVAIDVVTGQPNYPGGQIFDGYRARNLSKHDWNGATIHRIPLVPRGRGTALQLIWNYLSFVLSGVFLAPFSVRRKAIDIVFVYATSPILQAIPAIVLKWVKGAKLVIWVQDLWPDSLEATGFVKNRYLLAMVHRVVRWIYRQADVILVQSGAFIEPVAAIADRKKIHYYPNSADDVFLLSDHVGECEINGLDEGFSVVFAGNLGTAQAVETIINAAELLKEEKDIRIFLVGEGSRSDWIRDEIKRRQLTNVIATGRYPIESMPAILRQAGALLVTLKDQPIFSMTVPSKVQAYLAMGRPIIACMNGEGARIVVEANAGISCPAEGAIALAQAISKLSKMTDTERAALGHNGQRYFRTHFDSKLLTQTLISHFEQLLTPTAQLEEVGESRD